MTILDRTKFIKDGIFVIGSLLAESITDPQSTNRTSNEKFVLTAWPDRPVRYPVISVEQTELNSKSIGTKGLNSLTSINMEIMIFSKSTNERDILAGSIFAVMEQNQAVISASGLIDQRFYNITNMDDSGSQGLHKKLLGVKYSWPSQ